MRKDFVKHLNLVVNFIVANPDTYFREIVRELELNFKTVNECLQLLEPFLIKTNLAPTDKGLPKLPIYLKFKEDFTIEKLKQHLTEKARFESMMEKIKDVKKT